MLLSPWKISIVIAVGVFEVAGRVQMFNGVKKVLERLVSTDVCSLYPYVMAVHNCYYPCGKIVNTDVYRGDDFKKCFKKTKIPFNLVI